MAEVEPTREPEPRTTAATLEAVAFAAQRFLEAPAWEEAIDDVLRRLGEAAQVSRAYVIRADRDDDGASVLTYVHEWAASGVSPQVDNPAVNHLRAEESGFARWEATLSRGDVIEGPTAEFPSSERPLLELQDILSTIAVPIVDGGKWWGFLGFDDCLIERHWSTEETDALRAAAGLLGATVHRQSTEDKLRRAEATYRTIVEQIPAITYIDELDPKTGDWPTTFISPQVEEILGYTPEEWRESIGLWASILHPDDRELAMEADARHQSTGEPLSVEYRFVARDGRVVWVRDEARTVPGTGSPGTVSQGVYLDITARKQAEAQARETQAKSQRLVEQIAAITFTVLEDPTSPTDRRDLYISPQIEDLLGYAPSEWLAHPELWMESTHPDDRERVAAEDERTSKTGEPFRMDFRMIAKDGRVVWFREDTVRIEGGEDRQTIWQGVMFDITAQKEAEEALRKAEARYRAVVEGIPAVSYVETPGAYEELETTYISPQLERLLGFRPEEWIREQKLWTSRLHPDDRERVVTEGRRSTESSDPFESEYRLLAKDGREVWVRDTSRLIQDEQGRPLYWQGFMTDITERKRADEQLREAEAKYRAIVEENPAVTYTQVIEPDTGLSQTVYISPQIRQITGYTVEEIQADGGELWQRILHPDDRARVLAEDARTNASGEPFRMEYRQIRKDGGVVWVHDEATIVRDERGRPKFWQGFTLDITPRKVAEEQLRETQEMYRTLVEQIPAIVYRASPGPDGELLYVSPQIEQILGRRASDLIGNSALWTNLIHPEDRERVRAVETVSEQAGEPFVLEYRMLSNDGKVVWVQDEVALLRDDSGAPKFWHGVLLDITSRKQADEALREALNREREAASRLRALDEMKNTFLQAVSHDLRTPLAAILGIAVTLERADIDLGREETRDLAQRVSANARKLDRLVTDLLDLDRLARGIVEPKLHPTDVAALARHVVEESDLLEGRHVEIDAQPVVVPLDSAKVERILENLLSNTARHTPRGTDVWVRVAPMDTGVMIAVEDSGPGIPDDVRSAIFEPFRQGPDAPKHSPGVGIGLALVAKFAELHGGRAWVEERPGGGSSFRVYLDSGAAALQRRPAETSQAGS